MFKCFSITLLLSVLVSLVESYISATRKEHPAILDMKAFVKPQSTGENLYC